MKKISTMFAAILCGITLAGCASFAQHEVKQIASMPDVSAYHNKPTAYVEFKFYAGDPDKTTGAVEMVQVYDKLRPVVKSAVEGSQLFSRFSMDEFDQGKMDYVIKLRAYNHGSGGAAMVSGFLCGFTLGIIPGAATDNYTLFADVYDRQGAKVAEYRNKDAVTTWMGWVFLPMAGNTPQKAVSATLENQIKDVLKKAIEDQKLKYSMQDPLIKKAA